MTKRILSHQDQPNFARGYCFYKLFWVFIICGTLGIGLEYLYTFAGHQPLVNRTGVIYGQFSQVYGLGGVLMVLTLHRIRNPFLLLLTSATLGGIFEYACSSFQEMSYGSTGWNYSNSKYNLAGRTSLLYMLFWGVLGLLFVKYVYPSLNRLIERFPARIAKPLTMMMVVFMVFNLAVSTAALVRSYERYRQVPATNFFQKTIDRLYPDSVMRKIFPALKLRD